MPLRIKLKSSTTPGAVPASLDVGELAMNTGDGNMFVGTAGGVVKIVGTAARNAANSVAITGGTINGASIGATVPVLGGEQCTALNRVASAGGLRPAGLLSGTCGTPGDATGSGMASGR